MSKIRINDLARELEVKSKSILEVLPEIGVTEKKSHSSSLEDHEADKVRARLRSSSPAQTSSRTARPGRADADEIKTKIDLSQISKPGDALKAIISKQQAPATTTASPAPAPPVETRTAVAPAPPAVRTPAPAPPSAPAAAPPPAGCAIFHAAADFYRSSTSRSAAGGSSGSASASGSPEASSGFAGRAFTDCRRRLQRRVRQRLQSSRHQCGSTRFDIWVSIGSAGTTGSAAGAISRAPRMIVPQTGPRPVYKAPLRPAARQAPQERPVRARHDASRAGTPGAGTADFPASAARSADESPATSSWRAQADASDAPVAHGLASAGSRSRSSASGPTPGPEAGLAHLHAGPDSAMFRVV